LAIGIKCRVETCATLDVLAGCIVKVGMAAGRGDGARLDTTIRANRNSEAGGAFAFLLQSTDG